MPGRVFVKNQPIERGGETLMIAWLPLDGYTAYVPESEVTRLRAEVEALREEWKQSLPVLERLYRAVLALPTPLGREVAEAVDEYHAAIGRIAALLAVRKGEG